MLLPEPMLTTMHVAVGIIEAQRIKLLIAKNLHIILQDAVNFKRLDIVSDASWLCNPNVRIKSDKATAMET